MKKFYFLLLIALTSLFILTSCGDRWGTKAIQTEAKGKPAVAAPVPVVKINLKGKVVDYQNKGAVPGAKVIAFDGQEVTASDKGEFTLKVPQDKGFTFRVKAQGYQETLAGGRIKAAESGVEVPIARLNSGVFPVAINIDDKSAKVFKGPTVPKGIDITKGKLYQIAFPRYDIEYFRGITSPFALSYYDALNTHTWQYAIINSEGIIKSGKEYTRLGNSFFLLGNDNASLESAGIPSTNSNVRKSLAGGYDTVEQQWNMVGCWSYDPAPLVNFRIFKDSTYYTLEEAYTQNIIGPPVFYSFNPDTNSWEATSYPDNSLQPYKGYYLLVQQDCDIDISLIPPDLEADNVIKEFATKLRQNDVPGALSLFVEERRNFIQGILSKVTPADLVHLAQDIESAYFLKQSHNGGERKYEHLVDVAHAGGSIPRCRDLVLTKQYAPNWQIQDY
jgi:hypothetical protein